MLHCELDDSLTRLSGADLVGGVGGTSQVDGEIRHCACY